MSVIMLAATDGEQSDKPVGIRVAAAVRSTFCYVRQAINPVEIESPDVPASETDLCRVYISDCDSDARNQSGSGILLLPVDVNHVLSERYYGNDFGGVRRSCSIPSVLRR